jgi:GH15 family glucan-1,4-alpha-glucosidase
MTQSTRDSQSAEAPSRIEDYALLGDLHTAALVGRDGSVDWLCLPRFDGGACFAALLGDSRHGRWKIAPAGPARVERRYREDTLVLETDFHAPEGDVTVIDFMPLRQEFPDLVRIVVGRRGVVPMAMDLVIRPDYGSLVPWVRREGADLTAVAGPDKLRLRTAVPLTGENFRTTSTFAVAEGQRVPFVLTGYPSHLPGPTPIDPEVALQETTERWQAWTRRCTYQGEFGAAVRRSLITLKALTYHPTGGIVAAPTTSLPERIGGVRNWDYRIAWLRDATFTLYSLLNAGYRNEALAWKAWLLRAAAGKPSQLQIMYGLSGERRLTEIELPWLPGHRGSKPVRVGNDAFSQRQLDVFGEVMDMLHLCRRVKLDTDGDDWALQSALTRYLEEIWREPDDGIWEVRGGSRPFTHSKVMAWVALDRAIQGIEQYGLEGPLERWRGVRAEIHEDVCRNGYSPALGSFVQSYGSSELDASLLMIPLVGFLPATDPRVRGTTAAIRRGLEHHGFLRRYSSEAGVDGLPPGEGVFLACTFWLADNLVLLGEREEARAIFTRLLALRNDVGLLAEQYDPVAGCMLGNFPQAFSHVSLVNTAHNLADDGLGPAEHRQSGPPPSPG